METDFFTYANIIRVLKYDPTDNGRSLMIDVNTDDESILSVFDAAKRPTDLIFIKSFVNILNQSTVGFKQTDDYAIMELALKIIKSRYNHI